MLITEDRFLGSAWHKAEDLELNIQWTTLPAMFYAFTLFTTIGYGMSWAPVDCDNPYHYKWSQKGTEEIIIVHRMWMDIARLTRAVKLSTWAHYNPSPLIKAHQPLTRKEERTCVQDRSLAILGSVGMCQYSTLVSAFLSCFSLSETWEKFCREDWLY